MVIKRNDEVILKMIITNINAKRAAQKWAAPKKHY